MSITKTYLNESCAFICMLVTMIAISFAFTEGYRLLLNSTGILNYIINPSALNIGQTVHEVGEQLINTPSQRTMFVSMVCGTAWWVFSIYPAINGPTEVKGRIRIWIFLLITGLSASCWLLYNDISIGNYAQQFQHSSYLLLFIAPFISFCGAYLVGTGLFSPVTISGTVPFFNLRTIF